MAEYISREAAVEKITFLCELREIVCNPDDEFLRGLKNALNAVKSNEIIPSADVQPVNQWISCKDKMPEDNTSVLFVYVSENGIKSVHYGYHQTLKGLGSAWAKPSGGLQYCDDEVTHWQPIPEPPVND